MKSVKVVVLLVVTLILSPGLVRAHHPQPVPPPVEAAGVCPPVQNTPFFTIAYGPVTINDQDAPAGTIVEARTPRGEVAGCFAVSTPGHYGAMYVYGEDTSVTPPIPGMREGETVAFYVDGVEATFVPTLTWTNDWELHQVVLSATGASPPTAGFTAWPTSGVAPLTVVFTNTSTGDYAASLWDFGDGITGTLESPTHTYTVGGVYTVTLAVSGPGGTDALTRTRFITIYEPVQAGFTASPISGVAPLTVAFTNTSTGDYTESLWDFGDSVTDTLKSPTHTYTAAGVYTVTLTASGLGGTDTLTRTNYITVYAPVQAAFTASPTSGVAPLTVVFTNTSSGDYTASLWDFGNGITGTLESPTHTYTVGSVYTVTLTVSGPGGTDALTRTNHITVYEPVQVAFTASPTSGVAPLTVDFINTSTGDYTASLWDFGDGVTGTLQSPTHTYTIKGAYTVTLTVTGPGGSDDEVKADYITVYEPVSAGFTANRRQGIVPLEVTFTNQSTGDYTASLWDLGDEVTSTLESPTHTYTVAGVYTVSLTVSGSGGTDSITLTNYITVTEPLPVADFTAAPLASHPPLTVVFTDTSTNPITTWLWEFGDGETSATQHPTHTYTLSGTFTVSLTVTGPGGSDTEVKSRYIRVSEKPVIANFTAYPTSGPAPLIVQFTDESAGNITTWLWSFGDGVTSTLESPTHTYTTKGMYTVTLAVSGPGGSDDEVKPDYITVYEPVSADFTASPTSGVRPLVVTLTNQSTGDYTASVWDFGDEVTGTLESPTHTYTVAGVYTVSLTVSGPGGTDALSRTNYITVTEPPPVADFAAAPLAGQPPLTVVFTDTSTNPITTWLWEFGDGETSTTQHPTHTYTLTGTFTVSLTVTGPGGSDTEVKSRYIRVSEKPVIANFTAHPTSGPAPLIVQFTDASARNITAWLWGFGDGVTSTLQSPTYTYALTGTFTVSLTVSGPEGNDMEVKADYITVTSEWRVYLPLVLRSHP